MIRKNKCLELGLPEPHWSQKETSYVLSVISQGLTINTNTARYIGIDDLQNVIYALKRKGYLFTVDNKEVECPSTGRLTAFPIMVLSMTDEQQVSFKSEVSC
ncbi:hypothetical protein [Pseudoalteromonas sp. SR45-4]|uniref:hypothetical protein n=1 Tax=Pseudoalteromonas sp. SR45-4 TaxID=2760929 RepID=UPI0015F9CF70|nr:hypothetical protein [Pseudoalteromonas sp. SR45-4]MBB1370301.1 hypothetical protein [Pseudoalteromonas sp. SR45-4]